MPSGDEVSVDFERVELDDGSIRVNMARLTDGRVLCCHCFDYFRRDELAPVEDEPGKVWDVCKDCKARERAEMKRRGMPT